MAHSTTAFNQMVDEYSEALETFCNDPEVRGALRSPGLGSDVNSQIYLKMFFLLKKKSLSAAMYLIGIDGTPRMSTIEPPGQYDITIYRNWGIFAAAQDSTKVVVYPNVYLNAVRTPISLSLIKEIRNESRIVGYAIIDIPTETVAAICNENRGTLPLIYTIVDHNYYIVYDEFKRKQQAAFYDSSFRYEFKTQKNWRISKIDGRKALVWNGRSQKGQFFLVGTLYLDMIIGNIKSITFVTVGLGIIAFILCVILSIAVTKKISRPIQSIVKAMQKVEEGKFDVRVENDSKDEIGFMANRFNDMIKNIDDLFHTNLEKQDRLRLAELQALQAQINPHFLYNTLDSIKWLAKLNGIKEIEVIVIQLGKLLKNSINNQNEMTTIRESMEVIDSYLTIQTIRYSGRFEVNKQIDPHVLECCVPRLIIQPIVENAIIHGIAKKIGPGKLDIKINQAGVDIVVEVTDDGVGIEATRLQQIKAELESDQRKVQNIGIHNVNRRIKLSYGEKYGVSIYSEVAKGTKVVLVLPLNYPQEETLAEVQRYNEQSSCS
ncbi:MAG TPA: sensor histidine kinase [Bacillota bacterium]|nr:sensor histidine kinase [Bacillota bacterium]